MSSLNGTFRDGPYETVANADTALDSWITTMDGRFQTMAGGDLATRAYGSFQLSVMAEDGAGNEYTFRMSINFDTGTVGAGVPDANCQTIVTSLAALATAAEGASAYTTVREVTITGSLNISD